MPRFFFNIYDGISLIDKVGTELADWHEAQAEAVRVAGAVIANSAKRLKLGEDWMMDVTNEAGLVIFQLDFHIAGSAAIMGSSWKKDEPA